MSEHDPLPENVNWKSLPPLEGGVFVAMVTDVLDQHDIPNLVKTELESGGLGVIMGTTQLGRSWRIQVPDLEYDRAMEIYQSLMGNETPDDEDDPMRA
jgi:hypothetical protein